MPTENVTIDTTIGSFIISISSDKDLESCQFEILEPKLSLPPGMSVQKCRAILLRAKTRSAVENVIWKCEFLGKSSGSPCSGEGLDAQEWEDDSHLVVVGTEDEDFLVNRLSYLEKDPLCAEVNYGLKQIEVLLPRIRARYSFSLHFMIAENPSPEPKDCSCWFAVDTPHAELMEQAAS